MRLSMTTLGTPGLRRAWQDRELRDAETAKTGTHHSLYCSFHLTIHPSGTLGGGGPAGASKLSMAMGEMCGDVDVFADEATTYSGGIRGVRNS